MMIDVTDIINEMLETKAILEKGPDGALKPITPASLNGMITGLYFSAHWCPPCRQLTPVLAKKYKQINSTGNKLEIIFISGDQSKKDAENYFSEHPWKMLSFDSDDINSTLNELFEVNGIPHLVLLDENHQLLTQNGIEAVMTCTDFSRIRTFDKDNNSRKIDEAEGGGDQDDAMANNNNESEEEEIEEEEPRKRSKTTRKMSEQQRIERREKNREHAKRSRVRKKIIMESMADKVKMLQAANETLRKALRSHLPADEAEQLIREAAGGKDENDDFDETNEGIESDCSDDDVE